MRFSSAAAARRVALVKALQPACPGDDRAVYVAPPIRLPVRVSPSGCRCGEPWKGGAKIPGTVAKKRRPQLPFSSAPADGAAPSGTGVGKILRTPPRAIGRKGSNDSLIQICFQVELNSLVFFTAGCVPRQSQIRLDMLLLRAWPSANNPARLKLNRKALWNCAAWVGGAAGRSATGATYRSRLVAGCASAKPSQPAHSCTAR